jgi:hypothetical protein
MKELEGKTVYLRPTGNNCGRHSPKYVEAVINKVAKVNVTYTIYMWPEKARYDGMHLDNGHNGGWDVYENLQEIKDELFVNDISDLIAKEYPYSRSYRKLDRKTITAVAKLLGIKLPEEE